QFNSNGSHDLKKVPRFQSYRGFLFGSLNADAMSLEDYLGETKAIIDQIVDQAPHGLEVLRGNSSYIYDGNWKMQMENGCDGYTVDLLLDLHSMHEKSRPLIVSGPLEKGIELALAIGTPATVIVDEGHPQGRRMRDYGEFGDTGSAKNALLIECGQHWEASAVTVARDTTARFLQHSGVVDESDLPEGWLQPSPSEMNVVRVTQPVVADSMNFRFADAYTGLEVFPKAGSVIAWSNGQPVLTPYDDCVLVMPSLRQLLPGVTVVRLGKIERTVSPV
ncbi:hypothetical protein ACRXB1_29100, partial [Caballeronia sp. M23-90]